MYCSHFGLHRPPFNNTPDPTFYFSTPEHEEALATLQYIVFQRKGFVLVTGEVGAGKTLIGRMFLRQVDRSASVAVISHTNLTGRQLLAAICHEFELDTPPDATNLQLTERLQNFLLDQFAQDRFAVVLLDEAQNLPNESFEELRMLGNLEADDAKLLQICILGQPELRARFRDPSLKQIDQRLFRRFHLPALSRANTEAYIQHRLKVAGCAREDLFTGEAIDRIFAASQGVPRLVNKICDNALLTAYGANADQVTASMVEQSFEQEWPSGADAGEQGSQQVESAAGVNAEVRNPESASSRAGARQRGTSRKAGVDGPGLVPLPVSDPGFDEAAGSTAEMAENLAARQDTTEQELNRITGRITETWRTVREEMGRQRRDVQGTLDEAIRQYRTLQNQFNELASSAVSREELRQIRSAHQAESDQLVADIARQGQEFKRALAEVDERWEEMRSRMASIKLDGDAFAAFERIRAESEERTQDLLGRLDRHRQHIGQLADILQGYCNQTQKDLQTLRDAQTKSEAKLTETIQALNARMDGHAEQVTQLDRQVAQRLSAVVETVSQLEKKSLSAADLDRIRQEQSTAVSEVLKSIGRQSEELANFRSEITRKTDKDAGEMQSLISQIEPRISAQAGYLDALREKVSEFLGSVDRRFGELSNQFADRAESQAALAELRQAHETHAAEVLRRIEANRDAMKQLVGNVVERFRQTQKHLDEVKCSSAGKNEVNELRSRHEQESRVLIERLEAQKLAMEAQFDRVLWRLQETQGQIDTLTTDAARVVDLEQFRRQHTEDQEKVLAMLGVQRRNLESLVEATGSRCDELAARLNALPADVAATSQVEAVRREYSDQIRKVLTELETRRNHLEQSIQHVAEYCDRTNSAVSTLAAEAATSSEVAELRTDHTRKLEEINKHLSEQEQVQVNRMHLLTRKVKEHAQRVSHLEEEQRKPVRLELTPMAGQELSRVVEAATEQHNCLSEAVERAGAIASHIHNASAHVQEVMRYWADNADEVQTQSQHLRASAEAAARILNAMQKCQAALDRKLNSQRWQHELARGEAVAQRLEKASTQGETVAKQLNAVLRDFDRSHESADEFAARTKQAQQVAEQLAKLLSEAASVSSKVDQNLNRRKQMLNAVAQNTARLMDLIETARQTDESSARPAGRGEEVVPAKTPARKAEIRRADKPARIISEVEWPTVRVRPAHVG